MPSVWLELNQRQWHVDEGTPEHERLLSDGAEVCDDPTAKKGPAAKKDDE